MAKSSSTASSGKDGIRRRFWCFVRQPVPLSNDYLQDWAMRHIQTTRSTTVAVSVVEKTTGKIISQNHASFHMLGNHGSYERVPIACGKDRREQRSESSQDEDQSFLDMLFEGNEEEYNRLKSTVTNGMFLTRIQIHSENLRHMMHVPDGRESFQDLKIMITPFAMANDSVFIITHIDVTDTVLAQREVQRAYEELKEEKERMQLMIQRQYELLQVLREMKPSGSGHEATLTLNDRLSTEIDSRPSRSTIQLTRMTSNSSRFLARVALPRCILVSWSFEASSVLISLQSCTPRAAIYEPNGFWTDPLISLFHPS